MRTLIVDGYNVIHAWPELHRLFRQRGMDDARRRLVAALAEYAAQTHVAVTVVFDAHARSATAAAEEVVDGVTVRYGSTAMSADHVIERLANRAARAGRGEDVVIATNDRLERQLVGGMGVASIGVRSLVDELQHVADELSAATQRMRTEQQHAGRVEHRVSPQVAAELERIRRGRGHEDGQG